MRTRAHPLSPQQATCLSIIKAAAREHRILSYRALAREMRLTKTAAARHVASLQRTGRIERTGPRLKHARTASIKLTKKGQR